MKKFVAMIVLVVMMVSGYAYAECVMPKISESEAVEQKTTICDVWNVAKSFVSDAVETVSDFAAETAQDVADWTEDMTSDSMIWTHEEGTNVWNCVSGSKFWEYNTKITVIL